MLGLYLLQRSAGRVGHEQVTDHAADGEEDDEDQGNVRETGGRDRGHQEAPDAQAQARERERDALRRGPEHGGEHFLRPRLVVRLAGDGCPYAEEDDIGDRRDDVGALRPVEGVEDENQESEDLASGAYGPYEPTIPGVAE